MAAINCPHCKKVIGKEDRRKSQTGVPTEMIEGSSIQIRAKEAPRLKCGYCHKTIVLVRGSL